MHPVFKDFQAQAENCLGDLAKDAKKYYQGDKDAYFVWLQRAYIIKKARPYTPDTELSPQVMDSHTPKAPNPKLDPKK